MSEQTNKNLCGCGHYRKEHTYETIKMGWFFPYYEYAYHECTMGRLTNVGSMDYPRYKFKRCPCKEYKEIENV